MNGQVFCSIECGNVTFSEKVRNLTDLAEAIDQRRLLSVETQKNVEEITWQVCLTKSLLSDT